MLIAPDAGQRFGTAGSASQAPAGDFTQHDARADIMRARLQDAATLSGGEKSVSTLTLLSSIAKYAALPLRAIDEFDVFQDEANRKESIKALYHQSSEANEDGRCPQFILLTVRSSSWLLPSLSSLCVAHSCAATLPPPPTPHCSRMTSPLSSTSMTQ